MFRSCARQMRAPASRKLFFPAPHPSICSKLINLESIHQQRNPSCLPSPHSLLCSHPKYFSTNALLHSSKDEKDSEKVGIVTKFKKMMKDYWYVLIPVHLATSTVWAVGFYLMLRSGVDVVSIMEACYVPESVLEKLRGSEAGYYALTYACYKVATPARYTVTVGGTTFTIAKLTEMGYLRSTSELAATVKDKTDDMRENIKDRTEDMKEKYEERRDKVKEAYSEGKESLRLGKEKYKEEWENSWEKFSKSRRK